MVAHSSQPVLVLMYHTYKDACGYFYNSDTFNQFHSIVDRGEHGEGLSDKPGASERKLLKDSETDRELQEEENGKAVGEAADGHPRKFKPTRAPRGSECEGWRRGFRRSSKEDQV
jgi:hypothetical protein